MPSRVASSGLGRAAFGEGKDLDKETAILSRGIHLCHLEISSKRPLPPTWRLATPLPRRRAAKLPSPNLLLRTGHLYKVQLKLIYGGEFLNKFSQFNFDCKIQLCVCLIRIFFTITNISALPIVDARFMNYGKTQAVKMNKHGANV